MYGGVGVCDGARYPDGSYWHQWQDNGYIGVGVTWHYDCVGDNGNPNFPAPPPPGGCDGAIPLEPPPRPGEAPAPG